MKQAHRIVIALAAVLMAGIALAQVEVPELVLDPRVWFDNPFALAALVITVTGFVRAQFNTHGYVTMLVSFASGIGIVFAGMLDLPYYGTLWSGSFGEALVYGATAAVIASGGWDVVKGLLLEAVGALGKRS